MSVTLFAVFGIALLAGVPIAFAMGGAGMLASSSKASCRCCRCRSASSTASTPSR